MAGQQRKCANCRFFSDAGMPGNGWCTHPKRQLSSGVKLLVRGGELACRNSWGGDLFQSRLDSEPAAAAAADLPGNDQDDEVTSVSIPPTRVAPPEDRVVRDQPAVQRQTPLDANDAAHRDQEERARMMARGSRDALAHARQRFSSRHQNAPVEDVAADDNIPDSAGDRVVTRQERFSDREFAAGMPPMRTTPVPREEVPGRNIAAHDRFDTVPEIDPNFDMPGQRRRPEAAANAVPEPVRESEQVPAPTHDDEQFTAYEHVLQRARRIRASKQERLRPIRHTDILPARDDAAPVEPTGVYAYAEDQPAEERHVDLAGTPPAHVEPYAAVDPAWDDAGVDEFDDWVDEHHDTMGARGDETRNTIQATSWDEDDTWDDEEPDPAAASWDDDDDVWDDDGRYAGATYQHEPRRRSWLSRLRFGRRAAEPMYDDATITRHAASSQEYFDEESLDDVQGWEHQDADPAPTWKTAYAYDREDEPIEDDPGWEGHDPEPAPSWNDAYDNDLPAWQEPAPGHTYAEALPAPAPVPPPVPAAERAGDAWEIANMPVRPATASRHGQRLDGALPDLDDTLFEDRDDQIIYADREHRLSAEPDPVPTQESASARDSFFRASRYPRPEPATTFRNRAEPDVFDERASLPDLEGDRLDLRDVVARGAEMVDRRIEVAPNISRQCRTCRSFRSADGGTRGWCTNEWAFTHRRMVNDDDLACVSAIGCWWLPADHLRLDLDDDYDEARTPRMDELIARTRPATRRVVGE